MATTYQATKEGGLKMNTTYQVTVDNDGITTWRLNGKKHREGDAPAVYSDRYGDKEWFINDEYHRENGPAIVYADGDRCWFLNGKEYTKEAHAKEMAKRNNKAYLCLQRCEHGVYLFVQRGKPITEIVEEFEEIRLLDLDTECFMTDRDDLKVKLDLAKLVKDLEILSKA